MSLIHINTAPPPPAISHSLQGLRTFFHSLGDSLALILAPTNTVNAAVAEVRLIGHGTTIMWLEKPELRRLHAFFLAKWQRRV